MAACSYMHGHSKTAERVLPLKPRSLQLYAQSFKQCVLPSSKLAAVCTSFQRQPDVSLAGMQGSSSLQGVAA